MAVQEPHVIYGTVSVVRGATTYNIQGATVWIWDQTEGTVKIADADTEGTAIARTNSLGQYALDIANITSAYANSDSVRVYCEVDGELTFTDYTLVRTAGIKNINFALTRKSSLNDGLKRTVSAADRAAGLQKLGTGMRTGMKDGLR